MITIQMTLGEDLVHEVDRVVKELHTTRSAFARQALREAVVRNAIRKREIRHRQGYRRHPVAKSEFDVWEQEQAWGGG